MNITSRDSTLKALKYKSKLRNKFDIVICVNYSFRDFDDIIDYHVVVERTLEIDPISVARSLSEKEFRTDVPRIVSWNGIHMYDKKYNMYKTTRSNFNFSPDIRKYKHNGSEGLLYWKPRISRWSTGTVVLSVMHFACILGSSDIYLIGSDLCFKSEFDHYYKDKIYRDKKEFSKFARKHRVGIVDVEHGGKKVQTSDLFRDSAETLNELIPTLFKGVSVNTTLPLAGGGSLDATRTLTITGLDDLGTNNYLIGVQTDYRDGWEYKSLLGTTNQITVTHAVGSITLATPQDIHTGATPTFAALTLTNGLTVNSDGTTGEVGIDFTSINSTYSTIAQSDAEGITGDSDLRIGLDESLRSLVLIDRGDIGTDLATTAYSNPTLVFVNATASQKSTISHDTTALTFTCVDGGGFIFNAKKYYGFYVNNVSDINSTDVFWFGTNEDGTGELINDDDECKFFSIGLAVKQTSTAGYTALNVNAVETSVGSGAKELLNLQVDGNDKFTVLNTGALGCGELTVDSG
ncbi:hypothetical protein LCGC14_2397070, partial [marine sediment metagenome]